ncbi:MAG TPA: M90 family metallopeptidase [Gemmatimonadaceae bacterium]
MVFGFLRQRRREQLRARPFPDSWRRVVERNVPMFRRLPAADQAELLGHVQVFLAEKRFEGCGGLELTDEMRVTIAAQACLLLLHRPTDYFPDLTSILLYPSEYTEHSVRRVDGDIWEEGPEARLGHTALRLRAMVLAWDAVQRATDNPSAGNLVIHEFAHQLDFENHGSDGTPDLPTAADSAAWAQLMNEELQSLRRAQATGTPTVLDTYGAQNHAEFFAVATEAFFQRPRALRSQHPRLYAAMQRYFRQDPASYSSEPTAAFLI